VVLSKIFSWYGLDFGRNEDELRTWLAGRVADVTLKEALLDKGVKVMYADYDWRTNQS